MLCMRDMLTKYQQLPPESMMRLVGSKAIFGFGLGVMLASTVKMNWKIIGCFAMLFSLLLGMPVAAKIVAKMHQEE